MHGDGVVVYGEHPAAALLGLTERGLATTPVRHLLRCACALHRASTAEVERREEPPAGRTGLHRRTGGDRPGRRAVVRARPAVRVGPARPRPRRPLPGRLALRRASSIILFSYR